MTRRRIEKSTQVSFLSALREKQLNGGSSSNKNKTPKPRAILRSLTLTLLTFHLAKNFHFCDRLQDPCMRWHCPEAKGYENSVYMDGNVGSGVV